MNRNWKLLVKVMIGILVVSIYATHFLAAIASESVNVKVGIETLQLNDPYGRPMPIEIWYPASESVQEQSIAPQPFLKGVPAARGATYVGESGKRYPLVIVSHGIFGNRFSLAWLARELVSHGYLVVSVSHPGTVANDTTPTGVYRLWDRAEHISIALDHVLKDAKFSQYVDKNRIGFVGHSFGGGTGVVLAGGKYDAEKLIQYCHTPASAKDGYCELVKRADSKNLDLQQNKSSYKDSRIRVFYIMASTPAQGFDIESLRSIREPFFIETAVHDEILDNTLNSEVFVREISSASSLNRPFGHFAYAAECVNPLPAGASPAAATICQNPPGVARDTAHQTIAESILNFLQKNL